MGEWIDKAKGKAKQTIGGATGDRQLQGEGVLDEAKGKAKEVLEDVKHAVRKPRIEPDPRR